MSTAVDVALRIVEVLEDLSVDYHLGGSFASSIHGEPRQTHDVDIVVQLGSDQIAPLVQRLAGEFYADADAIRRAFRARRSMNLIHLSSGFRVDLFPAGDSPFERSEQARSRRMSLTPAREVSVKSPEDTILRKLLWYRAGGMTSDRQWRDVLGLLRVQGSRLDRAYLDAWADRLGISELLETASAERHESPPQDA